MTYELTPLEVCERLIGPVPVIAEVLGYVRNAPYLWQKPAKGRRVGDLPSATVMRLLLTHAAAHQIPLTADHLIWGASEAEIEALLAQMADAPPAFTSRRNPPQEAAA